MSSRVEFYVRGGEKKNTAKKTDFVAAKKLPKRGTFTKSSESRLSDIGFLLFLSILLY